MGGFFGITDTNNCVQDVFFGVDYHSHLGKARAGMAAVNPTDGFQREIHNIENSPFHTKFDNIASRLCGNACIGCISDVDPQPLLIRSKFGIYAMVMVGLVENGDEIVEEYVKSNRIVFQSMSGNRVNSVEIISALINQGQTLADGIRHAQEKIKGSASLLLLCEDGSLIAARDRFGRLPVEIGRREGAHCVSFEAFAYQKLGFESVKELRSGEIVHITPDMVTTLFEGYEETKICAFLWSYYGFSTATYEGVNVEVMRNENGRIMAENEIQNGTLPDVDYICGVPDSGTPHAIGYSFGCQKPFARPFIKYTPAWSRSFIPSNQEERKKIAKMKQIPVTELIKGKDLLFVDDSIVRGTQLQETVDFLYQNGAKSVHIRSACPPIMYGCKYLNFSRNTSDMDLLGRKIIMELEGEEGFDHIEEYCDGTTERGKKFRELICQKLHFDSLEFQTLDGIKKAIGIPSCKLCTYCWNGKE
ncbi:MAG: amidophosphoribosyltransferase [Clostridia bacterium]|nr:amidophosphoribosyltransferase [Clostridia bacterium]